MSAYVSNRRPDGIHSTNPNLPSNEPEIPLDTKRIPPKLNRRKFIKHTGTKALIGTGALATIMGIETKIIAEKNDTSVPSIIGGLLESVKNPFESEVDEVHEPSIRLFENEATEELKRKLEITVPDFVAPTEVRTENTEYLTSDQLLPIFHPAICNPSKEIGLHKELILRTAKESKINPNIVAFIASFRSGGRTDLHGGLFGLSQDTYDEFRNVTNSDDDIKNPTINAECAMKALKASIENVSNKSETKYKGLPEGQIHPEIYALAIHEMTQGKQEAELPINEQSEESYNNLCTIRSFFNTWNLAFNMRKGDIENGVKRMDDHDIRANLRSKEIDARMWAITDNDKNLELSDLLRFFSTSKIPDPAEFELKGAYDGIEFAGKEELQSATFTYNIFKEGSSKFTYPLNPWMRRHHATTSAENITEFSTNANVNAWSE